MFDVAPGAPQAAPIWEVQNWESLSLLFISLDAFNAGKNLKPEEVECKAYIANGFI